MDFEAVLYAHLSCCFQNDRKLRLYVYLCSITAGSSANNGDFLTNLRKQRLSNANFTFCKRSLLFSVRSLLHYSHCVTKSSAVLRCRSSGK